MATPQHFNRKGYVRRALREKEAKIVEDTKTAMFIKAQKTSQTVKDVLADISKLKTKDTVVKYNKKNSVRPFDDATSLEFYAEKSDAALFAFGSDSKKRPDNFVIGRFFNHKMLDMVELGVHNFKSMQSFKEPKHNLGSRTCVLFQGEEFENDPRYKQISNILLDFFAEQPTEFVNLACLDHILVFTTQANDNNNNKNKNNENKNNNNNEGEKEKNIDKNILMRHYSVVLKKSGTRIPRIELSEMGPSIDFELRRCRFASEDLKGQANTHFSVHKSKAKKNVRKDDLHQEMGTIHVGSQNLNELQQKRPPALRSRKNQRGEEGQYGGEQQERKRFKKNE